MALDVLRADAREGAFDALRRHVAGLAGAMPEAVPLLDRSIALARQARGVETTSLARQAASALYNVTSAAAMAWEAERLDDPGRAALARMVLVHRVLPRDPLAADPDEAQVRLVLGA